MNDISFTRIKISKGATYKARNIAGRLGLTPNIIYRFALLLSINESSRPIPTIYDTDGQELNRYTLFGEFDSLFVAILIERLMLDGLDIDKDFYEQLRAHINRGVELFYNRVKSLVDLYKLTTRDISRSNI
jgi:DNA sulfur modification protein DndE